MPLAMPTFATAGALLLALLSIAVLGAPAPSAAPLPGVTLRNAAVAGVTMPLTGLGTGSYVNGNSSNPSCWSCPNRTYDAIKNWLAIGGRRIDTALCYGTQKQVGQAIIDSGVKREEIFITSKLAGCSGETQGYNETLEQQKQNLAELQVGYVDLLLVHWPGPPRPGNTKDPACTTPDADGRWASCRRSTWKAMLEILGMGLNGGSRAVGVSNFEKEHLDDLQPLAGHGNKNLPSVNQIEMHPWWHEDDLAALHKSLGIVSNGYSPLGAPDVTERKHWGVSVETDPTLSKIAAATGMSNAQVAMKWELQKGWLINPRSANHTHQAEDLAVATDAVPTLTAAQLAAIDAIHPNPRAPPVHKVAPDPISRK